MLQAHAKPPADVTKADSFLNLKRVQVPVEVQNESVRTGGGMGMRPCDSSFGFDMGYSIGCHPSQRRCPFPA